MTSMSTKEQLLAEAEALVRTRGYSAFSYADLAERIGIRKASIHHHFATKEVLGTELIDNYLERFAADLESLTDKSFDTEKKLLAYAELFAAGLRQGMKPLCGALAADASELPPSMQKRITKFFQLHLDWLQQTLKDGIAGDRIRPNINVKQSAIFLLSTAQGSILVAWTLNDPSVVKSTFRQAIGDLLL